MSSSRLLGFPFKVPVCVQMVSGLIIALAGQQALAEQAEKSKKSDNALEEIVVTANKRSQSVQSISVSVSAVSGLELEQRGVTEFADYAVSIPNLSFGAATDGVLSARSISLRGIQGTNTTGFYIDDTPITETIDPKILDVERIEVLRGPTGTLYGGRSLGGTIRQITKRPEFDQFNGKFRAGFSSTDEAGDLNSLVSGSFNVPFSDNVAAIFSGYYEDKAGTFDRAVGTIADHLGAPATLSGPPTTIIEDVDDRSTVAFQASFLINLNERLSVAPRVMYQKTELDGFPLADTTPENFVQNRDFNTPEGGEDEWKLYTLTVDYQAENGRFTSAMSRFERDTFEFEGTGAFINFLQALPADIDGFGLFEVIGVQPVQSPIFQALSYNSTTQEFRFASDLDGSVNFVVGAFYQTVDDVENFQPRNFAIGLEDNFAELQTTLNIPGPLTDIWPFGDLVFTSERPTTVDELGVFGEVTFDLSEQWSLTVGSRWFDTEVIFSERQAGLAAGVPLANDVDLSTIAADGGQQNEDGFIFKTAIEYQANDDLFVYGSIAEGFRIGGANGRIPNSLGCPEDLDALGLGDVDTSSFESDDLISYEVGVKADLSDRVRLNSTLFYIPFDNIQQRIQLACSLPVTLVQRAARVWNWN